MITKEMKVSEILNKYPETIDIFIEASPHFKKLENKILRKTLARRVTVEQAAKIAGVDLNELLFKLNKRINSDFIPEKNTQKEISISQIKPEWLEKISTDKIVQLDVRTIINSGKDPFLDIMNKVKELTDDQVFLLINSFEPVPLYTVLGNRGFEHFTEIENDKFKVYFFRKQKNVNVNNSPKNETIESIYDNFSNLVELDVRELPPPEPMIKILESLSKVDENTVLVVHHHREPLMLYSKLEERGYTAISNKIDENYYKVLIYKKKKSKNL